MKLKCLSLYKNGPRGLEFEPGEIEVTEDIAAFLLIDSPDSFETINKKPRTEDAPPIFKPGVPETPAIGSEEIEFPPRDTAMRKAARSKRAD